MEEMNDRGVTRALDTYERFLDEVRALTGVPSDGAQALDAKVLGDAVDEVLRLLQARITHREFDHLAAQLPLVIRERLKEEPPLDVQPRSLHARDFVRRIADGFFGGEEIQAEEFVRCVFLVVRRTVSEGQMEDVESQLPKDIRRLIASPRMEGEPPHFPL